jgi:flavin-dependent dehydrogenase
MPKENIMQTEKNTYDAIVVGSRCAGSPTAMLLARQGHRVLLVDRARFPSDKPMSTHYIMRPGGAALGRWGLLERLAKLGAPAHREFSADFGPVKLVSDSLDDGLASATYCPRRFLLDKMLLDAAIEAGVEFREDFAVRELIRDGDRVVGVRGGSKNGAMAEEHAKIVVGADGLSSVVARETGAKRYHDVATKTGVWWGYFRGLPLDKTNIWFRPRRLFAAASSDDDLAIVMIYIAIDEYHEFSANLEENFMNEYRECSPDFYEKLAAAKREGNWVGTGYQPNYFRESAGPGWALVGDAGRHHDSINPSGISKAFTEAEMLSEAIHAGLTGSADLDQAVINYQTRRDARWMWHWQFAIWLASMEPPTPEFVALLGALATQPAATRRFFAFFEGQQAESNFMDPANLAQIVSGASAVQ